MALKLQKLSYHNPNTYFLRELKVGERNLNYSLEDSQLYQQLQIKLILRKEIYLFSELYLPRRRLAPGPSAKVIFTPMANAHSVMKPLEMSFGVSLMLFDQRKVHIPYQNLKTIKQRCC